MKILISEDSSDKLDDIYMHLKTKYSNISIDSAGSIKSTNNLLEEERYDFLLLDMSMPKFDNDSKKINPLAGKEILFKIKINNIKIKVIIVTRFSFFGKDNNKITLSELESDLKYNFESIYVGTVFYSYTSNTWKNELEKMIDSNYGE